jgi:photosystem II stability/assembly factor-like uncharacterized protein
MGALRGRVVTGACTLAMLAGVVVASPGVAGTGHWTTTGPDGGIVRAVAIDPLDADRALVGTQGGGIFRSTDGGTAWSRAGGLHPDATIWQLAFAPTDPTIAYAATDSGAYRSENGGAGWMPIFTESTTTSVTVDPTDADVAFVTAALTLYRTDDGGESWTEIHGPHGIMGVNQVVFAPSDPDLAYATSHGELLRSTDAGITWTIVVEHQSHVVDMAIHPSDPEVLVVGTLTDGVLRSPDGGVSWTDASAGLTRYSSSGLYPPVRDVEFDVGRPNRVFAATDRRGVVYRSTDAALSWTGHATGISYAPRVVAVAADSGSPVFVGTDEGGVIRSIDRGITWKAVNGGVVGSQVTALVIQPGTNTTVVAATGGQGIFRTTNGASSWMPSGLGARRITTLAGSPSNPGLLYAGGDDGLWRSMDAGRTWSRVRSFTERGVVAVAVAPSDPRRIYLIQFEHAWRSTDGGATWNRMNLRENFASVAVHPRNPRVVLVGTRGGVFRSDDSGGTWRQGTGLPLFGDVHEIVIDASRPWLTYAATDVDGVARSRDGGRTWRFARAGLGSWRVRALAVDASTPDRIYAGTLSIGAPGGVYVSTDRGASWTRMSAGLTTTWTEALAVSPNGRRLYAGTTAGLSGGGGAFGFVRP